MILCQEVMMDVSCLGLVSIVLRSKLQVLGAPIKAVT